VTRGVPGSTPGHGTPARYNTADCRCEPCKAAHIRQQKRYRMRRLTEDVKVPRTGTRRRLQALAAIGWTSTDLAVRLGVDRTAVSENMRYEGPVLVTTAARTRALYDELSMTPGPSAIARARALAKGWAPPLAWDDDTIDDPKAKPYRQTKYEQTQTYRTVDEVAVERVLAGEVLELTEAEREVVVERLARLGLADGQIADRIGVWTETVLRTRRRLGIESRRLAACRDEDPEMFFHPDGQRSSARRRHAEAAKAICRTCPVSAECLMFAVDTRQDYGTWGGLSEDERIPLLTRKARP
jgi:hypothetical protein